MSVRISRIGKLLVATCLVAMGALISHAADAGVPEKPTVHVLATDPTALEGASSGAFTLIRYGAFASDLAVNYTLSGTASNGVDYLKIANTTTLRAGFAAADIVITPIFNPTNTGNKKVVLTLLTNANYRLEDNKYRAATVSIVEDSYNNQPPTVSLLSPTNGSVFAFPATITLNAVASDVDDAIAKVSFYANDDFLGQSTSSPFTLVWTNARAGKYALFARATDAFNNSTLSSAVHITVTNIPPTITLLSPANGAVFGVRSNVKLEADASDRDGSVVKVQFFGDNRLLGSVTNKPYSLIWSNVPPGRRVVTARVTDSAGTTAEASAKFTITNAPPVVSIASPADGAAFAAHSNIALKANATDSDDAITRVSFYANSRFLGRVTKSPYDLTWTNAPAGTYKLSAIATDEFGESTTSKSVSISVK